MRKLPADVNISADSVGATAARHSERRFIAAAALLFAASGLITTLWCASMASMASMPMPGGWRMSMTWMRMPGQSWPAAGAAFVTMWSVMMVAMMLPSLVPMLWRYRQSVSGMSCRQRDRLTTVAAAGYFLVWTLLGAAVFVVGVSLAAAEMQVEELARAVPLATALVMVTAGALQLTSWKARALACCQAGPTRRQRRTACAFGYGLQLGVRCTACCVPPTAILLALGVMNLPVMAAVTALISAERLAPRGERVARIGGVVLLGAGLGLLTRSVGRG
jgi:predicted metal-binding membrane protein